MKAADPEKEYQKLIETVKKNYSADDTTMVVLAFEFAAKAHAGQLRASGEPYIVHPLATAQKLAEIKMDLPTVIAGLLHDIPEDDRDSLEEIKKNFGKEVASLVAGVTKLGVIKYRGMERYAENLRKMFIAMSDDIRVILIKFADRLHNLKTLSALPVDKQLRIARESLEIYAPIADRLCIGQIKGELEDLSFPYVYPKEYRELIKIFPKQYHIQKKHLERIRRILMKQMAENQPPIEILSIHGRAKHLYSLHKKLQRPHIDHDLSKVYDLIALRIIVPTIADCYSTLGIIHKMYKPMPGRIKDYIAQPKPNGYQSLHTTVFTERGAVVEFQIRTNKMHEEAEFGIAAHWNYKEHGGDINKKIKWLQELVRWQNEIRDSEQFLSTIKFDVFQNRIFVFTPKGDVIDLPEESTPIDFAYHVHTWLGDKCVGARVNGQISNLNHKLKSGDIVEIITDKNRTIPSPDWLETVKTSMAKNKIKAALNRSFNKMKKINPKSF